MAQAARRLICIREMPGSILRREVFRGIPQTIWANTGIVPGIGPELFPPT
jgi:hypothetical protein